MKKLADRARRILNWIRCKAWKKILVILVVLIATLTLIVVFVNAPAVFDILLDRLTTVSASIAIIVSAPIAYKRIFGKARKIATAKKSIKKIKIGMSRTHIENMLGEHQYENTILNSNYHLLCYDFENYHLLCYDFEKILIEAIFKNNISLVAYFVILKDLELSIPIMLRNNQNEEVETVKLGNVSLSQIEDLYNLQWVSRIEAWGIPHSPAEFDACPFFHYIELFYIMGHRRTLPVYYLTGFTHTGITPSNFSDSIPKSLTKNPNVVSDAQFYFDKWFFEDETRLSLKSPHTWSKNDEDIKCFREWRRSFTI